MTPHHELVFDVVYNSGLWFGSGQSVQPASFKLTNYSHVDELDLRYVLFDNLHIAFLII